MTSKNLWPSATVVRPLRWATSRATGGLTGGQPVDGHRVNVCDWTWESQPPVCNLSATGQPLVGDKKQLVAHHNWPVVDDLLQQRFIADRSHGGWRPSLFSTIMWSSTSSQPVAEWSASGGCPVGKQWPSSQSPVAECRQRQVAYHHRPSPTTSDHLVISCQTVSAQPPVANWSPTGRRPVTDRRTTTSNQNQSQVVSGATPKKSVVRWSVTNYNSSYGHLRPPTTFLQPVVAGGRDLVVTAMGLGY